MRGWRRQGQGDTGCATALILASGNGHLEVARLLCEYGADKIGPTGNQEKEPKTMENIKHGIESHNCTPTSRYHDCF